METPEGAQVHDDGAALVYLSALPVVLVSAGFGMSLGGWWAWPGQWPTFGVGIGLLVVGIAGRWWTHRVLGRFHQAVVTIHRDHRVVTDGPYRVVRHPMYAASALALVGTGLALGTVPAFVMLLAGTLPAIVRRIRVEEAALYEHLGPVYGRYADGRARLVPGLW